YAQAVSVVDVPPQVGDHAITVRLGLARGEHCDFVEQVAVAIQVHAEIGTTADIAGLAILQALTGKHGTAAVGLNVLIAGIDREDHAVGEREARSAANIARVRRVVTTIEFRAAARTRIGDARTDSRFGRAREVDVVFALVLRD